MNTQSRPRSRDRGCRSRHDRRRLFEVVEELVDEAGRRRDAADAKGRLAHALQRQREGFICVISRVIKELQGVFGPRVIQKLMSRS